MMEMRAVLTTSLAEIDTPTHISHPGSLVCWTQEMEGLAPQVMGHHPRDWGSLPFSATNSLCDPGQVTGVPRASGWRERIMGWSLSALSL